MGTIRVAAFAVFVAGFLFSGESSGAVAQKPYGSIPDEMSLFATDLYGRLAAGEGNIFFSPYSVSTAMAMTYGGARGATADQMAAVLRFEAHTKLAQIRLSLLSEAEKSGTELSIANALWPQKGATILPAFTDLVRKNYEGEALELDYVGATEAARQTINLWVEIRTKERIKDLIKPGLLSAATRLVLTNAIYFKGKWAEPFAKSLTKDLPFKTGTGEHNVPMMTRQGHYRYAEDAGLQMLELPYKDNAFSMVVLLPKDVKGLGGLEGSLTSGSLNARFSAMQMAEVRVYLPKFTMTEEYELTRALAAMGMKDAFDAQRADFSGIDGQKDLVISDVVHKAFVEVTEEGTEAAAATGVGMRLTSAMPMEPKIFRADHPFVFVIRDQWGVILFMGRVAEPKV